ncbi:glycoside hydrolase family 16 protein [Coraliomargarita sp. SDUM461003]|uniref:Glycoside hydrolase family 16 protein n=1 Tax=Thalassobacterium maritimum TaxID=3041265 RepID=A0ABU1AX27_9BACT|nr:glycoside hydrolase family 16 protein [Coraliomargarita sp. SDUM461003]MDQ8208691.1 glycoside hydrolase family 16 protein [Coraliomargarita sp. SDUM461003]
MISTKQAFNLRLLTLLTAITLPLAASTTPASPVVMAPASAELSSFLTENKASVSIIDLDQSKVLELAFPTGSGYPGINLPVPADGWDLSAYAGLEAEIVNTGSARINVGMRVDNKGHWKNEPWNSNNAWLAPGDSTRLRVTFGQSFGKPAYQLNSSEISAVKLFVSQPPTNGSIQIKSIQGVGKATTQAAPQAKPTQASTSSNTGSGGLTIYNPAQGVDGIKIEEAPQISVDGQALTVRFPEGGKYPAINFESDNGSWDLSAYNAVEAVIENTGNSSIRLGLRIDNAGHWKNEPWSTAQLTIAKGDTKTLTVPFGMKFGKPSTGFDPAKIINVKLMALSPKPGSQLRLLSIKPVQSANAATGSAVKVQNGVLFDPTSSDINNIHIEQTGTVLSKGSHQGAPAVDIKFATDTQYPGLNFLAAGQTIDLSNFGGVNAQLHNAGSKKLRLTLRVDNKGHWKNQPWNTSKITLQPGETKDLRVTFGQNNNNAPGFPLDASKITQIKLFATDKYSTAPHLQLLSLNCVAKSSGGASGSTNFNVPAIDGVFYKIHAEADLSQLGQNHTSVSYDESTGSPALKVDFDSSTHYPNVTFPCPDGGWNMETFGGIKVDITNLSDRKLSNITMRVDNPSTPQNKSPWNNEKITLEPGETKTLELYFGGTEESPKYPLDPTKISGVQIFQAHLKQDSTLLLKNLRAFGSPKSTPTAAWTSSLEDRNTPVTPPEWLGTRPPVEGDWVVTFDEDFEEGTAPNPEVWNYKLSHDALHPGEARNTADNVYIEDGAMVIKAEVRTGHHHDDPELPTSEYSSGAVTTYDKWTQCYGYMEARMKLPKARGLWPAFWTMPDRGEESGLGKWERRTTANAHGQGMEIDILEYLTEWGRGRNNVATHWDGYGQNHKSWSYSHMYYGPTPDGWHTFGLLWEPGKLSWYIDGQLKCVWENERIIDVPSYLILNLQMGRWATKDVDRASLPDYFKIDYVRAWQLKERL